MAISFVNAGAVSIVNNNIATPGLPGGFQAGDIHILQTLSEDALELASTGWDLIQVGAVILNLPQSAGNGRLQLFWRRAQGGDTTPNVSGADAVAITRIFGFRGCKATGNPFSAASIQANTGPANTITGAAIIPADANSMIGFAGSQIVSLAPTFSAYSGTDPVFTEGGQNNDPGSFVNPMGQFFAYGIRASATSTGNRTATSDHDNTNVGALFALAPEGGGSSETLMGQALL